MSELEKLGFIGKTVKKKVNGHLVDVFIPSCKGPSWEEVKPIFEKMGKILEEKKLNDQKI